jgi:phospholipid/cholesterol/gamma-HCH transport system permease protein
MSVGYFSLPVVTLTAFFTGMVLALQTYTGFVRFSATEAVPTVVILSIVRELGPVLGALMVCGRVSASIAAELGTMRVTDQIDAMSMLQTDPFQYLIVPRILAGIITLPILILVGDIIGVWGGYLIATLRLGFNPYLYIDLTFKYLKTMDVMSGLIKAGVFGFLLTLMGTYFGFHASKGAYGVGLSTTKAVVCSSILVLISNYILTAIFFTG